LANNNLTGDGKSESGILALFEFLQVNTTLEKLNLANNHISSLYCGLFRQALAANFKKLQKNNVDYSSKGFGLTEFSFEGNSFSK